MTTNQVLNAIRRANPCGKKSVAKQHSYVAALEHNRGQPIVSDNSRKARKRRHEADSDQPSGEGFAPVARMACSAFLEK
jgi:hypothetical protein